MLSLREIYENKVHNFKYLYAANFHTLDALNREANLVAVQTTVKTWQDQFIKGDK